MAEGGCDCWGGDAFDSLLQICNVAGRATSNVVRADWSEKASDWPEDCQCLDQLMITRWLVQVKSRPSACNGTEDGTLRMLPYYCPVAARLGIAKYFANGLCGNVTKSKGQDQQELDRAYTVIGGIALTI